MARRELDELVDRETEADLIGAVFNAVMAVDVRPDHEGARRVIVEFAKLDTGWICSRDLRRIAQTMQTVQRREGIPLPLAVRDELRRRGHVEELRALPMVVARSAAVVSGWAYYVGRVREMCARRRDYLAHVNAAAEILTDGAL